MAAKSRSCNRVRGVGGNCCPGVNILSEAEIGACRADGVVVPEFRLPPDELAHLQSLAARLIADNPHMGDMPIADSRGSAHHTRPLIQVRGRDVSGLDDFGIGHPRAAGGGHRPLPA